MADAKQAAPRRHGGPLQHKARFVLTVEAKDGQTGIHSLRWLLKQLGHRGLRCIDAYEDRSAPLEISNQVADEFRKLCDEVVRARAFWRAHDTDRLAQTAHVPKPASATPDKCR